MSIPRWLFLIAAFAACGCSKGTSDLISQLKAEDATLRLEAVHALQEKVDEPSAVVPALMSTLHDSNTYVRRDAARALGHFGTSAAPDAVPALIDALRDKEASVRKAAAAALKKIDPIAAAKAGIPAHTP